jgi:DNA primase
LEVVSNFRTKDFENLNNTKRKTYSKAFINQLTESINMADFVESEYDLILYASGNGWVKTNCLMPNHNDSSPSFGINVETNFYNCFGCQATGNIFSLVQNVEGLNFVEAIQRLSIYSGLSTESTELDMKQTLREFNFSIEELLSRDLKTNLPGGISETQFLFSIAERLKAYERRTEFKDTKWTDLIYSKIDEYMISGNEEKLKSIWKNLGKKIKERENG